MGQTKFANCIYTDRKSLKDGASLFINCQEMSLRAGSSQAQVFPSLHRQRVQANMLYNVHVSRKLTCFRFMKYKLRHDGVKEVSFNLQLF